MSEPARESRQTRISTMRARFSFVKSCRAMYCCAVTTTVAIQYATVVAHMTMMAMSIIAVAVRLMPFELRRSETASARMRDHGDELHIQENMGCDTGEDREESCAQYSSTWYP